MAAFLINNGLGIVGAYDFVYKIFIQSLIDYGIISHIKNSFYMNSLLILGGKS